MLRTHRPHAALIRKQGTLRNVPMNIVSLIVVRTEFTQPTNNYAKPCSLQQRADSHRNTSNLNSIYLRRLPHVTQFRKKKIHNYLLYRIIFYRADIKAFLSSFSAPFPKITLSCRWTPSSAFLSWHTILLCRHVHKTLRESVCTTLYKNINHDVNTLHGHMPRHLITKASEF